MNMADDVGSDGDSSEVEDKIEDLQKPKPGTAPKEQSDFLAPPNALG